MGKIAGFKTLAHEKALPFFEGHISWIASDGSSSDVREE